jgi:hypothetical protein
MAEGEVEAPVEDVRAPTPLARVRTWLGPPRPYVVTRWLILRLFGVVYLCAFLGVLWQGLPLFGAHGLTPAAAHVDALRAHGLTFWDVPSLFAVDPFGGAPARFVRIRRFVYHLQPVGAPTWWTRTDEQPWLPPVSLTTPGLREAPARYGMPSPPLGR